MRVINIFLSFLLLRVPDLVFFLLKKKRLLEWQNEPLESGHCNKQFNHSLSSSLNKLVQSQRFSQRGRP